MTQLDRKRAKRTDTGMEDTCESTDGVCPECHCSELVQDHDQGEVVCADCGLVVSEEALDRGPEWRAFDSEEGKERSRVGAPLTSRLHDRGLTTEVGWRNKDASGQSVDTRKRKRLHRLRQWQQKIRTNNPGERNLQFALSETDRMASALGVPRNIREVAAVIYRRALEEDLIRGRSIEAMASASLYTACRKRKIPRSLEEIQDVSRVDRTEIGRAYRYLVDELDIVMEPVNPKRFIPRYASDLDLSEEVVAKANEILDVSMRKGILSGKSPTGFAASALYAASCLCNEKRTQQEVAAAAEVTSVTIRNRYKEQLEAL